MKQKLEQEDILNQPLAARMRPRNLDDFVGQKNLISEGGPIRKLIKKDEIVSMIFWGPPGCGKTTLARIIANETVSKFIQISAVDSGKDDLRKIVEGACEKNSLQEKLLENKNIGKGRNTIVFIDEIHRFNKAQQDFLLPYVEDGTIVLIGATTENPSFEVISALLSRCRVFVMERHNEKDMETIIRRALNDKKYGLGDRNLKIKRDAMKFLSIYSNGDPRTALNTLEMAVKLRSGNSKFLSKDLIEQALQHKALLYDKDGEEHYNLISALHKSMRSSNEDAAVYWTARMLEAGEDPLYIARRMLRFASEDVGNADTNALVLANAVFEACDKIGVPECNVFLSQLAIYLSRAPKNNGAYIAYSRAKRDAINDLNLPVPLHLRNAPTKLMKDIGYGKGYIYDHDLPNKKSEQQCLPDKIKGRKYVPR